MDQVKRAASRLRRLQRALAPTSSIEAHRAYLQAPFSVRPFLNRPWVLSLRKTIDDTVVAFVPPNMPLSDSRITCSDALVEYRSSGHWTLNARIEASGRAPVVFVIGFMTNQRGYFGGLIGAVNFAGTRAFAVSPTNTVTISAPGFSKWIQKTYGAAVAEGLTIRIHSSVNLQAPIRSLAQQWAGQFGEKTLSSDESARPRRRRPGCLGRKVHGRWLDDRRGESGSRRPFLWNLPPLRVNDECLGH